MAAALPVTLFAAAVALCSCAAQQSPEACLAPKLAPLETAYFAEAMEVCKGYTWEECPSRDELEAKFDARRAEAIKECQ